MTREGCTVAHGNCLVEIASSLLPCRHRYLLAPTHTLKLMQMQSGTDEYADYFHFQNAGMCVREHAGNAGNMQPGHFI